MSAVAAMANNGAQGIQDDDVVCTPDFPLEPLCEVMCIFKCYTMLALNVLHCNCNLHVNEKLLKIHSAIQCITGHRG